MEAPHGDDRWNPFTHQPSQVDLVGQHDRAQQPRPTAEPLDNLIPQRLDGHLGRFGGGDGFAKRPDEACLDLNPGDERQVLYERFRQHRVCCSENG